MNNKCIKCNYWMLVKWGEKTEEGFICDKCKSVTTEIENKHL